MNRYSGISLDAAQQRAVDADGRIVVAAIPGSGKTAVITHRVRRLILDGADPNRILAVTFLKRAQESLAERLVAVCGDAGAQVCTKTYHALGKSIIEQFGDLLAPGYSRASLLDDESRRTFRKYLRSAAEDLGLKWLIYPGAGRKWPEVTTFTMMRYASAVYDLMLDLKDDPLDGPTVRLLEKSGFEFNEQKFLLLSETLRRVDDDKLANRWMTYDDMLHKAIRLVSEHPEAMRWATHWFDHVCVDEYQDTSPAQQMLVDVLSAHSSLVMVGDDDQTLYSWRRAHPEMLIEAASSPAYELVKLETNYRSGQAILDAADKLITHNVKRIPKRLIGVRDGGTVRAVEHACEESEMDWVVNQVDELYRAGVSLEEVMILCRTNARLGDVAASLMEANIPYQLPPQSQVFCDLAETKDIESYMRLSLDTHDDSAFSRVYNRPYRSLSADWLDEVKHVAKKNGMGFLDAATSTSKTAPGAYELLASMRRIRAMRTAGVPAERLISEVLVSTGYRSWLQSDEDDEDNFRSENVDRVIEIAKRYGTTEAFLDMLDKMRKAKRSRKKNKGIMISTVHRAKGLESDVVFVLGVRPGQMPHAKCSNIEEERRICYVACTRARHGLFVSRDTQPSRTAPLYQNDFIAELGLVAEPVMAEVLP